MSRPKSCLNIYIYIYKGKFWRGSLETWDQPRLRHTKYFKKWYLISPCLTLGNIRYVSRVKRSNSGKGVAPSPTPRCSSY